MGETVSLEGTLDPIFVSVKQAALVLNISPWSCRKLLDEGAIACTYFGRRRLVYAKSLREYADRLMEQQPESA